MAPGVYYIERLMINDFGLHNIGINMAPGVYYIERLMINDFGLHNIG